MNNTESELKAAMDRLDGALELMRTSGEAVDLDMRIRLSDVARRIPADILVSSVEITTHSDASPVFLSVLNSDEEEDA